MPRSVDQCAAPSGIRSSRAMLRLVDRLRHQAVSPWDKTHPVWRPVLAVVIGAAIGLALVTRPRLHDRRPARHPRKFGGRWSALFATACSSACVPVQVSRCTREHNCPGRGRPQSAFEAGADELADAGPGRASLPVQYTGVGPVPHRNGAARPGSCSPSLLPAPPCTAALRKAWVGGRVFGRICRSCRCAWNRTRVQHRHSLRCNRTRSADAMSVVENAISRHRATLWVEVRMKRGE